MKKLLLLNLLLLISSELSAIATDYTYGYWLNGWRKNHNDSSADLFAVETSQYGLLLDMDDLSKVQFGLFSNTLSYEHALVNTSQKVKRLPRSKFLLDIIVDGVKYRAQTGTAGLDKGVKRLSNAMLWESGRYVQHYEFVGLDFRTVGGKKLDCNASLELVAWPDTVTFNLKVTPELDLKNAYMQMSLESRAANFRQTEKIRPLWKKNERKNISLTCNPTSGGITPSAQITVKADDTQRFPVTFDKTKNCYIASVNRLNRKWKTGYTDIRDYDEFRITVNSLSVKKQFLSCWTCVIPQISQVYAQYFVMKKDGLQAPQFKSVKTGTISEWVII